MADILFSCTNCRQELVVDRSGEGLTITCPKCHRDLTVPMNAPQDLMRVSELDTLAARNRQIEAELKTSREKEVAAAKAGAAEQAKLQDELRQAKSELQKQKESLRKAIGELNQSSKALGDAQGRIERMETAPNEALAKSEKRRRQECAEATAREDALRNECQTLRVDLEKSRGDLEQTAGRLDEQCRATTELERRLATLQKERDSALAALDESREEHQSAASNLKDVSARAHRLEAELNAAREALTRTETDLYHSHTAKEGLEAMLAGIRANLAGTTEMYSAMASTVDQLENELQRVHKSLQAAGAQLNPPQPKKNDDTSKELASAMS